MPAFVERDVKHPIPTDALDDRLAIVGTAGSGKTYAAGTAVERILKGGHRVVVVDPLGVWYGLRLLADGSTASAFNVVIFGGPHGDLPITEHAGALIGETVAGMAESCILDLSALGTKAAERRFMLAFLTALYRKMRGDLVHVIFDEADMFAPQVLLDKEGEAAKLLGMMETIVRRGRVRGFIPWLITQRPAVLSKNVLSQADGLVAMKLTSSQDRDAIGDWVQGQADKAQWKEMWGSLATMQRGQGLVWIPGRSILTTAQFPAKTTFDSSRAPTRGERRIETALKPIDLGKLKDRLSSIETETKANDPVALKRQIAELKRELAAKPVHVSAPAIDEQAIVDKAFQAGFEEGKAATWRRAAELFAEWRASVLAVVKEWRPEFPAIPAPAARIAPQARAPVRPVQPMAPAARRAPAPASANGAAVSLGAERKPLALLAAAYPAGYTEAQWATLAGFKRTGGTWSTYKSRLRSQGLIEQAGDLWFATPIGIDAVGETPIDLPTSPRGRLDMWKGKIAAVGPMLDALYAAYPEAIERERLAERIGMTPTGGSFNTYLSRLRSNGLLEEPERGLVRLSAAIMENGE